MWKRIQSQIEWLGVMWCQFMHASVRWPIYGSYECGTCHRRYPVPWHQTASGGCGFSAQREIYGRVGVNHSRVVDG